MAEISGVRKVVTSPVIHRVEEKIPHKAGPGQPIGIFDSGVGGLTVLKEISRQLPREDVIYIADTARVPYGSRSPEEIVKINHEIIQHLLELGVKLVIMACGTSSAIAYPVIKGQYKIPLISLIEPGARSSAEVTRSGKIGIIATEATVKSGAYQKAIPLSRGMVEVHAAACPLFVPLVEGGFTEAAETKSIAREYLKPLLDAKIDTLILGCTHYPHLTKILKEVAGPGVKLVDPAAAAVAEAKKTLEKMNLTRDVPKPAHYQFIVTGSASRFQELGSKLFGKPITNVQSLTLG